MKIDRTFFPSLASAAVLACGGPAPQPVTKAPEAPAALETDSTRLVARAIAALDSAAGSADTVKLKVHSFIRSARGTVIELIPVNLILGGGGSVAFRRDGSVARVELGQ